MAIPLQLDAEELLTRRGELENSVLASSVSSRGALPETERAVREVGGILFDRVFTGPVGNRYQASLATAQAKGEALRIDLNISAPELAALPWETMFDGERQEYVCRLEPLVRHVPVPSPVSPLPVSGPLRILGIIASPGDLPELDVDEERQRLSDALAKPLADGRVELHWAAGGTWDDLQGELLSGTWHVIHFIGHGGFDPEADEGVLYLIRPDGRRDLVRASRFAILLREADPPPRLVVLNSCSSGETGGHDVFSSTAATLVRQGISAVAAMQFAITDPAALAFSRGFYRAIAGGKGVDEAVRSGRTAILGTSERTLEWVTPVLYLRGGDSHLFTVDAPRPHLDAQTQPGPVEDFTEKRNRARQNTRPGSGNRSRGPTPVAAITSGQEADNDHARRVKRRVIAVFAAGLVLAAVLLVLILSGGPKVTPPPPPPTSSQLSSGATLHAGQSISSPNGRFVLTMRPDGNLVDRAIQGNRTVWESATSGHPAAHAYLQTDGNLVVYPKGKTTPLPGQPTSALWSTGTSGLSGSRLEIKNNGDTVLTQSGGGPIWRCGLSGEGPSLLGTGGALQPGQSLWSPNGQFTLTMQSDGNLVEYQNGAPSRPGAVCQPFDYANVTKRWSTMTDGHLNAYAIVQKDGDFVVYPEGEGPPQQGQPSPALWFSGTSGPAARLQLTNGGSLVLRLKDRTLVL